MLNDRIRQHEEDLKIKQCEIDDRNSELNLQRDSNYKLEMQVSQMEAQNSEYSQYKEFYEAS